MLLLNCDFSSEHQHLIAQW